MSEYDVIVIGGGPAGTTAALRARELGARVALVEAGEMGGTCANGGCVPVRVFAKAARLLRDAQQYADYGVRGERPSIDFPHLMTCMRQVVAEVREKKNLRSSLTRSGVEVIAGVGDAQFATPHAIVLRDGRQLTGQSFVLCAGGYPRRLDVPGGELAGTVHDVWNLRELPGRIVVVGAAATGCQLASIFHAFGAQVTLMEMAPRIMFSSDADVSAELERDFTAHGMAIITGLEKIERIEAIGLTRRLHYRRDGRSHALDTDAIITSIGWPGNASRLNLPAAGVAVGRNGYLNIDEFQRTSVPHIFAAGDSDGSMMLVQTANYEGPLAAENAVLGTERLRKCEHQVVPYGGFTDPEYGSVGLSEEKARDQFGDDIAVSLTPYNNLDRAVIDDRREGFCKLIVRKSDRQVLGAHVVGEDATEIVQVVAATMQGHLPVDRLADLQLSYPTFTGIVGLCARDVARQIGAIERHGPGRHLPRPADWERRG